jgi:3-oxoacyl-[acyl-carrier protein] reductase
MSELKKRALITGATGEIGRAIAQRLAKQYQVIIHTHSQLQKAEEIANEIIETGGSAEVCQFDITDALQVNEALKKLLTTGPIAVLVNNAGVHLDAPFAGMATSDWHKVMDITLNGFYHVTQPLLLPMMAERSGRIISISSVAALIGNRGQVNYSAAKAGLHGASRSLAVELASRNITVNVIAPGIISGASTTHTFSPEQIKTMVPMQRAGKPDEVAALVAFLASDDAAYISGQVISINGAMI